VIVLDQLTNDSSPDEVAEALIRETIRRGYDRAESIAATSTMFQESGGRMVKHPTSDWWGPFQQDASYPDRRSMAGNIRGFLDRLDDKLISAGASTDPFKNIFWLQQRPSEASADDAYNDPKARRAYYPEIQRHVDRAAKLYDQIAGGSVAVSGDPFWLEPVWREALGDRLVVHDGWKERGTGGVMGVIWGTVIHHTGNDNERVEIIRDGVQQPQGWLPGPLSQALITRDGKLHLIAVGPCNHAGPGSWKTLTNGNRDSIGIECAYDGDPARWPDVMVITMRDATAAVSRHIGKRADDSVCGHKEYAKPQGRKPDPANFDMDWFRREVQKDLDGFVFPGEKPSGPAPIEQKPPAAYVVPPNHTELMYDQQNGRWEMLGWNTQVEALAILLDAVTGTKNAGKRGFTRGPRP
jgi:hypothetical protein